MPHGDQEYVEALLGYQARSWSCALTGKGKLTCRPTISPAPPAPFSSSYLYLRQLSLFCCRFEEALLSERQAQRKGDEAFPEIFVEPLCRMAHMSQVRMDELIERAFLRLQGFVADEEVMVSAVDHAMQERPARVVQAVGVDEDYWADLDAPAPTAYLVEFVDGDLNTDSLANGHLPAGDAVKMESGDDDPMEEDYDEDAAKLVEVDGVRLKRPKGRTVSRMTIKSKLKTIGSRQAYWQAPFLCEPELVSRFGMQADLPPHLHRLKLQHEVRTGKLSKDAIEKLDPSLLEGAKRKRRKGGAEDPRKAAMQHLKTSVQRKAWAVAQRVSEESDSVEEPTVQDVAQVLYETLVSGELGAAREIGVSFQQYRYEVHLLLASMLAAWSTAAQDAPTEATVKPLLNPPVEDALLAHDPDLKTRPTPGTLLEVPDTELALPGALLGQVLLTWDFLTRFGKTLRLAPFALEDLSGALLYPEESPLAMEVFSALLRYILSQHEEYVIAQAEAAATKGSGAGEGGGETDEQQSAARRRAAAQKSWEPDWGEDAAWEAPLPESSLLDSVPWPEALASLFEALAGRGEGDEVLKMANRLRECGFTGLVVEERVEVLAVLCDHACATAAIHDTLNRALEETLELHKEMRQEDQKLKEAKREAKQEKAQTKERIRNEILEKMAESEGGQTKQKSKKQAEAAEKALEKQVAAAAKAALAAQKEEDSKREERERQARESLQKTLESELEKHSWRLEPLGRDREHRTYWLLSSKDHRIFVQEQERPPEFERPALAGDDVDSVDISSTPASSSPKVTTATPMPVEVQPHSDMDPASHLPADAGGDSFSTWGAAQQQPKEYWGFYDRQEQVDALLAFLNPNGRREGALYEQVSMRYMKLTGNMRRHQQAALKADAVMHSDVRRSIRSAPPASAHCPMLRAGRQAWVEVHRGHGAADQLSTGRVKVDASKKQIPFLSYRNSLKEKDGRR